MQCKRHIDRQFLPNCSGGTLVSVNCTTCGSLLDVFTAGLGEDVGLRIDTVWKAHLQMQQENAIGSMIKQITDWDPYPPNVPKPEPYLSLAEREHLRKEMEKLTAQQAKATPPTIIHDPPNHWYVPDKNNPFKNVNPFCAPAQPLIPPVEDPWEPEPWNPLKIQLKPYQPKEQKEQKEQKPPAPPAPPVWAPPGKRKLA